MQVWCDWQLTLCDPHLSALEVRFSRRCAIQIDVYLTFTFTMCHDLHWLPVQQRIKYKLGTMVFKYLRRMAPSYLADMYTPVSSTTGSQHLRSAARHNLTIPQSRLARYRSRSFATSGPSIWNLLPLTVRDLTLTFTGFCIRLKTELLASI